MPELPKAIDEVRRWLDENFKSHGLGEVTYSSYATSSISSVFATDDYSQLEKLFANDTLRSLYLLTEAGWMSEYRTPLSRESANFDIAYLPIQNLQIRWKFYRGSPLAISEGTFIKLILHGDIATANMVFLDKGPEGFDRLDDLAKHIYPWLAIQPQRKDFRETWAEARQRRVQEESTKPFGERPE